MSKHANTSTRLQSASICFKYQATRRGQFVKHHVERSPSVHETSTMLILIRRAKFIFASASYFFSFSSAHEASQCYLSCTRCFKLLSIVSWRARWIGRSDDRVRRDGFVREIRCFGGLPRGSPGCRQGEYVLFGLST